jgi:hypothetical protein
VGSQIPRDGFDDLYLGCWECLLHPHTASNCFQPTLTTILLHLQLIFACGGSVVILYGGRSLTLFIRESDPLVSAWVRYAKATEASKNIGSLVLAF